MALFTVRVFVTLKPSVFDPQGRTIVESLHSMGYAGVSDVRQGKYFEVQVEAGDATAAESLVREVSTKLLANPVIESFRLDLPAPTR
jgi:phosphoribosylformylglycinamidine synthase PurS subunit